LFICLKRLHLDRGELLDPRTQVIWKQKRSATTFDSTQFTSIYRAIESRPTDARDRARFHHAEG
jgi:hypothetical protein